MNNNHRYQTQFSPEKNTRVKKMGFLLSVYLLSAIPQAEKQTNKQVLNYFNNMYDPDLHIIQSCNIYKTLIIMMIII